MVGKRSMTLSRKSLPFLRSSQIPLLPDTKEQDFAAEFDGLVFWVRLTCISFLSRNMRKEAPVLERIREQTHDTGDRLSRALPA